MLVFDIDLSTTVPEPIVAALLAFVVGPRILFVAEVPTSAAFVFRPPAAVGAVVAFVHILAALVLARSTRNQKLVLGRSVLEPCIRGTMFVL